MKRILISVAAAALVLSGPAAGAASKARAIARLVGIDGQPAGTVTFAANSHGVLMVFDLKGLAPGAHAIHIHTSGSCDPKVAFSSVGLLFCVVALLLLGFLAVL